jgi:hypothetical protein
MVSVEVSFLSLGKIGYGFSAALEMTISGAPQVNIHQWKWEPFLPTFFSFFVSDGPTL